MGEHFPAIGAPTSVGQVYLGPFYYYFIAPWLLFFGLNPIGPAIGVLFFSCLYLLSNFLIVNELFDKKVAYISTCLLSFSYVLIQLSRFSWNPNLLPFFTLLTIYFFIKSLKTNRWYYYLLTGAFLSFAIQLHYLALFLIPPIGLIYLFNFKNAKKILPYLKNLLLNAVAFFVFSFPLIVFDLRHQFLNSKNFIGLFHSSSSSTSNRLVNLLDTFVSLNQFSFAIKLNGLVGAIILILLIFIFVSLVKKNKPITTFFYFFFFLLVGFSLMYTGEKLSHYFGVFYPVYFVIISYFIAFLFNSRWEKYLGFIFIIMFILTNSKQYNFLTSHGDNQLKRSKKIAQVISNNVKRAKFTVTALPEKYSDSTYRYYLEIWNKRAIEKDSLVKADELFVVCEKTCPTVIGNPQWDIAYFAPTKVVGEWQVDGVKIYKLTR